jgi:hypothetical protein
MKSSSPAETRKGINRTKARNCALMNQLGTPGLGSLMGGKILPGIGQLALALAGFGLFIYWFVKMLGGVFAEQNDAAQSYAVWGLSGGAAFAVSWFWSLATSLGLMRDAKKNEITESAAAPPHIN